MTEQAQKCWHNRFHPTKPPCDNDAVWQSTGLGNCMDDSMWCIDHSPDPRYRRPVTERGSLSASHQQEGHQP